MMIINTNTKIAAIIKQNPAALEAIISISPKFSKLRNPLLRKIMASRTSIHTAAKVGGCTVEDFYRKLEPLGFVIDKTAMPEEETKIAEVPSFMQRLNGMSVEVLDVRPAIEGGKDPFQIIMKKIETLPTGAVLKLINSFEPVPLINILSKQGFEYFVQQENENLVNTFFYKKNPTENIPEVNKSTSSDWDAVLKRFENNLATVDVRQMEMPQPMIAILDALEKLPAGKALFVYHKRIPVFLLPELQERKFEYRIKEISDGEVHMLIFNPYS